MARKPAGPGTEMEVYRAMVPMRQDRPWEGLEKWLNSILKDRLSGLLSAPQEAASPFIFYCLAYAPSFRTIAHDEPLLAGDDAEHEIDGTLARLANDIKNENAKMDEILARLRKHRVIA
jgi:hypothetical protein